VLKECIAQAGGLEEGLKYYVGAANREDDGGYAARVLTEQHFLERVAAGKRVPTHVSNTPPAEPQAPASAVDQVALVQ